MGRFYKLCHRAFYHRRQIRSSPHLWSVGFGTMPPGTINTSGKHALNGCHGIWDPLLLARASGSVTMHAKTWPCTSERWWEGDSSQANLLRYGLYVLALTVHFCFALYKTDFETALHQVWPESGAHYEYPKWSNGAVFKQEA